MKIYQVYFLVISLLVAACTNPSESKGYKISKKQTIVIGDTFNMGGSALKIIAVADTSYLDSLFKSHGLIDVQSLDSTIKVNLKYSDILNFLRLNVYEGLKKAYFPC